MSAKKYICPPYSDPMIPNTLTMGALKIYMEYLPEKILEGKDPPPDKGCGAAMLFKNPSLRNLGQRDWNPMAGKGPYKR